MPTATNEVDLPDEARPDEPATAIPGEVAETASTRRPAPASVAAPASAPVSIVVGPMSGPISAPLSAQARPGPATGARPIAASTARTAEAPPNREELLARLRERAGGLPRERVEEILAPRSPR
jgi:hypothetical protein